MSKLHPISGCDNAQRKADVIFIHGLGGDPFSTWRHGKDDASLWPRWIGQDFPDVAVWSFGYAASPTKLARLLRIIGMGSDDSGQGMSIPNRGLQALDLMVRNDIGKRPLFFICHSLGGLVAKQILRTSSDAISNPLKHAVYKNARAVLFLATPHNGSDLASNVSSFRALFPTITLDGLRAHDDHLRELYNWYRGHADGIRTETYYEMRTVAGFGVVNPTSAQAGVGEDAIPMDEDHLSIAKPRDRSEQVFIAAKALLCEAVLGPPRRTEPLAPSNANADGGLERQAVSFHRGDRRIPRQLPDRASAGQLFGRDEELRALVERLERGEHCAVVGPAGLGKTALAAEALAKVIGNDDAGLLASPFPDGVVLIDLYRLKADAEATWNALANALDGDGNTALPSRRRAIDACRNRRALIVVEGAEVADGCHGHPKLVDLLAVMDPANRRLVLTRDSVQVSPPEMVRLSEALDEKSAKELFDRIAGTAIQPALRDSVLTLLEGHPLALTWAASLLARGDETPERLLDDWRMSALPALSDPIESRHTLRWLFERSARGLASSERGVLEAAGLLAHAGFPLAAMAKALGNPDEARKALKRLVQSSLLRRSANHDEEWHFSHVLGYQSARREAGSPSRLRIALSKWLRKELDRQFIAVELLTLPKALQHAAALLRVDDDQSLWPLVKYCLYNGIGTAERLGQLSLELQSVRAVEGWFAKLPTEVRNEPRWLRERGILQGRLGDMQLAQGNLAAAQRSYSDALAIRQKLVLSDPANGLWQRDLSLIHERLGDLQQAQGELAAAHRCHADSFEISAKLVGSDPTNSKWQRDLSVSHDKLGELEQELGDLASANRNFSESLAIRNRLATSDESNATRQLDLAASYERLGNVQFDQKDLPSAQRSYSDSLSIRQRLAISDPANAQWQRALGVSFGKVARAQMVQGDFSMAQVSLSQCLAIRQKLATSDPSNTHLQRDLSSLMDQLCSLAERQGIPDKAIKYAEEREAIDRRLAKLDPDNAKWQSDFQISRQIVARLRGGRSPE